MGITKDELKGMKGKRITIDGVRHRVAKVAANAGTVLTEEGAEAHMDGIYKRGPGYFFDTPKKGKKAAVAEKPASTRARSRKADAEDDAPTETPRQRRRREKREREAAENGGKQTSTRARSRNKAKDDDDEPSTSKRSRKVNREADADAGAPTKAKKKKIFESFEQAIAERLAQEILEHVGPALAAHSTYNVIPVAVGATFNDDSATVKLTFMSASKSAKEIKAYIRDHRESTDVAPDDEDDDQLDDDDLTDDDDDDQAVTDELLGDLDVLDAKKIARKLGLTTKKSMDLDAVIALIREDDDNDDDAIREAAEKAGVELPEGEEEESDDADDDADDDSEDDPDDDIDDDEADDDTDSELDDDEEESDDDDDDSEEDESEEDDDVSVDDMVEAITEIAPKLNADKVRGFVESYLASDEIEEKFGDDMVPGQTRLTAKGDDTEFLLVGYDEEEEQVKLLNLSNKKFRSKSIADAARMEIVEADD